MELVAPQRDRICTDSDLFEVATSASGLVETADDTQNMEVAETLRSASRVCDFVVYSYTDTFYETT